MENYRDELMQDQSFIRCSVLIAELLIKYRNQDAKDNENHKEPETGSVHIICCFYLQFSLSSFIILIKMVTADKK